MSSLTPLRGLAALWIIVYHFDEITSFTGLPHLIPRETTSLLAKGYLWVDFFFLLSGFIITHVYAHTFSELHFQPVKDYIVSRFARLYPLHILILSVHVVFYLALSRVYPDTASAFSFLYPWDGLWIHFVFGEVFGSIYGLTWNPPAWSVGAEWWTYILAIPVFFGVNRNKMPVLILLALIGICTLFLIPFMHEKGTLDTTFEFGLLRCFSEFGLGIALYQWFGPGKRIEPIGCDICCVVLFTGVIMAMHFGIQDLLIVGLFALLIVSLAHNHGRILSFLNRSSIQFIGNISFSLYMLQAVWLNIYWMGMKAWAESHPGHQPSILTLVSILMVILTVNILSAWLLYSQFENPARQWVKNSLSLSRS